MVERIIGKTSKIFIQKNFANELNNNIYYDDILESIEKHSDIYDENLSDFCILIQFCDKVDFSKYRLEDNYREKFRYYCYEEISNIEFIYNETIFGINIITEKSENFEKNLWSEKHPYKVKRVVESLAEKLNRKPVIMHNGVEMKY